MVIRLLSGIAALALLCSCKPAAPPPANQAAANAAAPQPAGTDVAADLAKAGLREWLIGTWSFERDCATDLHVHYNADGSLDNSGEIGTWAIAGDEVTETITQKLESGGEEPVKADPPEVRKYRVVRGDPNHGVVNFERRSVPMLRC
jgi:hypothetical protein